MTEYRPILGYRTSGNNSIELKGEWVSHLDQAREVIVDAMDNDCFFEGRIEKKESI